MFQQNQKERERQILLLQLPDALKMLKEMKRDDKQNQKTIDSIILVVKQLLKDAVEGR